VIAEAMLYDLVQLAAGSRKVRARLESHLRSLNGRYVLDIGAGTGTYIGVIRGAARYVALDLDASKLARLTRRHPDAETVIGDARRLPFGNDTFDTALCIFVAHHLDDAGFGRMLDETQRVSTQLVLLDPLRTHRIRGRLLWRIDRGGYPRTESEILSAIGQRFEIETTERFTIHHTYLLCCARR
jgi:ubiquinone/menaquinone biosynthesis C-methylase UbiE